MSRSSEDDFVILARRGVALRHLRRLRQLVTWAAAKVGLSRDRGQDLALAVSEAAGNVIKHGGGTGHLELIQDDGRALIAKVTDHGPGMPVTAPTAVPPTEQDGGRGLYLIQESVDRVEYRTGPDGTTVHLEMDLDDK